MNKTVLIAMIGLLTTLLVGQAVAGSITITRSGASVDEFVDGDNHSLEDSSYDHGILLGNGFWKATPVYRILLPPPTSGGNQITSITITIEGNDGWLSNPYVYIGTPVQVSESIGDGEYVFNFTESDARNLLASVGDGLGYTLDVKIDVGGLTDQYDLKEIKVTYEYSGVSDDILKRYHEAYAAYLTLKEYESGMVDSLWDQLIWIEKEYFYPAIQKALAFADNLSGLSGSLYDSLKTTIYCIEEFQNLTGIAESESDYKEFWVHYAVSNGPSKVTVSSSLTDASSLTDESGSFQEYAQNLLNYAFDGEVSSSDAALLNEIINTTKTKTEGLRQIMWDVATISWFIHMNFDDGDGRSTGKIMLYSLAPLLNITYNETQLSSEPSYLTGLINELSHFPVPPVTFNDANLKALVEGTLGIVNPTASDMLGLTQLYGNSRGIIDLTGLEYATNLYYLALADNQISDISALTGLTNLEWLTLVDNPISDISALTGLTNLEFLALAYNPISDISALTGLTNLVTLALVDNQISDISALIGLTKLVALVLVDNQISDISALTGLTNLTRLDLDNNPLDCDAILKKIPIFIERGVNVSWSDDGDTDRDDDGILNIDEDENHNGIVDPDETDPCNLDTDGDGIQDGTELGYTLADIGPDTDTNVFIPDQDPGTTSDPLNSDTDGDGLSDGQEDTNHNGMFDPGELDPNHISGDVDGDADVDLEDSILALQVMTGIIPSTTIYKEADVNRDGRIGMVEVIYILKSMVTGEDSPCTDSDGDGYAAEGGECGLSDCNDNNSDIHPGASEICGDGIDQDCNGSDLSCSSDGSEWTIATDSAPWGKRTGHTSVVFDGKMWVLGGGTKDGAQNDVWYSSDGINWTQATAAAQWSKRYFHSSVVFDGKMWVLGGTPSLLNDVWYSSDGINWTQATAAAQWSPRNTHSVVYDGKIWVFGYWDGYSSIKDVWYSSDGINWTQATDTPHSVSSAPIVYDGRIWICGGWVYPNFQNDVWYSSDGTNWSQSTAAAQWSGRASHTSLVFDNKMWVLGGKSDAGYLNDVWYSSDGTNWSQSTAAAQWSVRNDHESLVFDNKMWILGGRIGSSYLDLKSDVWYSSIEGSIDGSGY